LRNGTVATAGDDYRADIGIKGGRITAIAERLPKTAHEIDATDRLVLPGAAGEGPAGVDAVARRRRLPWRRGGGAGRPRRLSTV
jgi:hypothetical protein